MTSKTYPKKGETPKGSSKGKREIMGMVPNTGTPRISENKPPGRTNSRYKVKHTKTQTRVIKY